MPAFICTLLCLFSTRCATASMFLSQRRRDESNNEVGCYRRKIFTAKFVCIEMLAQNFQSPLSCRMSPSKLMLLMQTWHQSQFHRSCKLVQRYSWHKSSVVVPCFPRSEWHGSGQNDTAQVFPVQNDITQVFPGQNDMTASHVKMTWLKLSQVKMTWLKSSQVKVTWLKSSQVSDITQAFPGQNDMTCLPRSKWHDSSLPRSKWHDSSFPRSKWPQRALRFHRLSSSSFFLYTWW